MPLLCPVAGDESQRQRNGLQSASNSTVAPKYRRVFSDRRMQPQPVTRQSVPTGRPPPYRHRPTADLTRNEKNDIV